MRAPRRKPGSRHWKRVPGVIQRVHRTPTEWHEIMARFRASGQSKTKFCAANAIARRTFTLWERRLAAGDVGATPAASEAWFVEVEDDGDEVPPPRGSGLFAEVTDAGALVTDPASRRGLEDGGGWPHLFKCRIIHPVSRKTSALLHVERFYACIIEKNEVDWLAVGDDLFFTNGTKRRSSIMHTLAYDATLNPVLERATTPELAPLVALIMRKLSEELSLEDPYKRHFPDHEKYPDLIAEEIRRFGGNTFANLARGGGPAYHEIACDVAKALKAPHNKMRAIEEIEASILATVCERAWEKMSEEERREILGQIGRPNLAFVKSGSVMACQAILRAGGFATYRLMLIVVNRIVTAAAGRGLPFVINWLAAKGLSITISPVAWAASTLMTLNQIAGPSYRVIIPCVVHVAGLRLQQSLVHCPNCDAVVADACVFCPECGAEVAKP